MTDPFKSYGPQAVAKLERFREIWLIDTEFAAPPGHVPHVVCVVARELRTNTLIHVWEDELERPWPPYSVGRDALCVAYFASAEWQSHLSLNWPLPENVLDLYVEFVSLINGERRNHKSARKSLLGALRYFGVEAIASEVKDSWRERIQQLGPWTPEERDGILDYCQSDVDALAALLPRMLPHIEIDYALHRGRFTRCVAKMQQVGLPIDIDTYRTIRARGVDIQAALIEEYETKSLYRVYEDTHFRQALFEAYLVRVNIPWPRLLSGALDLKDQTFKDMSLAYPQMADLRELRHALTNLRELKLAVGPDGRNRTLLGQFGTVTSRNAPRAGEFLFGPARWIRGLLKPGPERGVAYLDWSAQEVAIAAALSGDDAMVAAYESGDPYLTFGRQSGVVPTDASKSSHPVERDLLKTCVLGIGYGMQEQGLADRIHRAPIVARDLLNRHHTTYGQYWKWVEAERERAYLTSEVRTPFGWRMSVTGETRTTTIQNWPIQSVGAEMLRVAIDMLQENGISVCAPIHDAVVIEADVDDLDDTVSESQALMRRASRAVLRDAIECRVDATIVKWPHRYRDERPAAGEMWDRVMRLLKKENRERSRIQAGATTQL